MTSGVLGIIGCPMLEDNLIHCLRNDPEEKDIAEHMTPEMMEMIGIEPGQDGYMRWLLSLGYCEHMLKLDNGIGNEGFDENLAKLAERTRLDIMDAEPGGPAFSPPWTSTPDESPSSTGVPDPEADGPALSPIPRTSEEPGPFPGL